MRSLNHATSYLWPHGWTHTHTRQGQSDFKKPGARRVADMSLA